MRFKLRISRRFKNIYDFLLIVYSKDRDRMVDANEAYFTKV